MAPLEAKQPLFENGDGDHNKDLCGNGDAVVDVEAQVQPPRHAFAVQTKGTREVQPKPSERPPSWLLQGALLAAFTLMRSLHPLIIGMSKVEGKYLYNPVSVPFMECVFTFFAGQALALQTGGVAQWRQIWRLRPLAIFSMIGFVFAIGDFLELRSLASVSGPTYMVLSQSKLMLTACMLYVFKGTRQSGLQWILLVVLMMSLVCDSLMTDLLKRHEHLKVDPSWEAPPDNSSALGVALVLAKVFVSCLGAVLTDKFLKEYKDTPVYMQFAQMKVVWGSGLGVMMYMSASPSQPGIVNGVFHDWNTMTVFALVSFILKNWSTTYLLAILDSLLKNIGEACAVLVTYFIVIFHGSFDDVYEHEKFITVVLVFLSVSAYLASKSSAASGTAPR